MMDNNKKGKLAITATCVVLGIMLAVQFHSVKQFRETTTNERVEDLVRRLNETEKVKNALEEEVEELRKGIPEEAMKKEQQRLKALAGMTPLRGTGIRVTLDDSKQGGKLGENANLYIIHDEDLLKVINELRASGAEAVAVNGQRLIAISEIRCVGPTLLVNGVRYSPPYEISAIGDPKTMEAALKLRGGVTETLRFYGIQVQIKHENELEIPAFKGNFRYNLAHPVEEQEAGI